MTLWLAFRVRSKPCKYYDLHKMSSPVTLGVDTRRLVASFNVLTSVKVGKSAISKFRPFESK